MPRRKSDLSRQTRNARAGRRASAKLTEEQLASRREHLRQRAAKLRSEETEVQRAVRNEVQRLRARRVRSSASDHLRAEAKERNRLRMAERRRQLRSQQNNPQQSDFISGMKRKISEADEGFLSHVPKKSVGSRVERQIIEYEIHNETIIIIDESSCQSELMNETGAESSENLKEPNVLMESSNQELSRLRGKRLMA